MVPAIAPAITPAFKIGDQSFSTSEKVFKVLTFLNRTYVRVSGGKKC